MDVIPAIDILGGDCVRLVQGDFSKSTVFSKDPLEMAKRFEASGAYLIHLVDLDGARCGFPVNLQLVAKIASKTALRVELGGGLRSLANIKSAFSAGAHRVVLGTLPFRDPDAVSAAVRDYPDRILAGLDCRGSEVVVQGWTQSSGAKMETAVGFLSGLGLETFIYTDVSKDGTMSGPSAEGLRRALATGVNVIASGGITSLEDLAALARLEPLGLTGAIIGRALYEGAIDLEAALRLVRGDASAG